MGNPGNSSNATQSVIHNKNYEHLLAYYNLALGLTLGLTSVILFGGSGDEGLIPRICFELFSRMKDVGMTYRVEVSYLEIYNEKVNKSLLVQFITIKYM